MDLKQYEQHKFAIAEIIRSAQAIDTTDGELLSQRRELAARLAEDRFNLLVVGRFSRGKSTLMNALLGSDSLPTGIVPITSVITTVRYGSRTQVVLNFNGSGLRREVPLSQLPDYVTQKGNPGNIKKLAYAEIELPVELLRRGFFFVDTPGLGSPIIENTLTTERFLPEADAFLLVTSYESPLSEEEDRILNRIRHTNKKIFFVINKQDTVSTEEKTEALNFLEERLERFAFALPPQVFSVSARQALEAKLKGQDNLATISGLPRLEAELFRFLTEERAQAFLSNMYERTRAFLMQRSRIPGDTDGKYQALVEQLRGLRESIFGVSGQHQGGHIPQEIATEIRSYPLKLDKRAGCSVCASILAAIFGFLSRYQYQLTTDSAAQHDHAERGGFCPLHTWQYENVASPYGVCASYPELAHRMASELQRLARDFLQQNGATSDTLRGLLSTARTCSVCEVRIAAEKRAVDEISILATRATPSKEEKVAMLCLPHLVMVADGLGTGEAAQRLLQAHSVLLERTAEDLQRYAVKYDGLRRYLTSEEERQAAQLALLLLAGHRSVNAPWAVESIM
jgi:small GTP-binding protein